MHNTKGFIIQFPVCVQSCNNLYTLTLWKILFTERIFLESFHGAQQYAATLDTSSSIKIHSFEWNKFLFSRNSGSDQCWSSFDWNLFAREAMGSTPNHEGISRNAKSAISGLGDSPHVRRPTCSEVNMSEGPLVRILFDTEHKDDC